MYYSTSSTPPTVATTPNMSAVTGVSTTIAGLSPNTEYYVWMRSLCTSETGPWNGSYLKFKTSCAPVASLYEGFETTATGNFVPTCWERMAPSASAGSMSISTATPAAGTKNVYQYASTTQSPTIVALPEFSNVNAGTHWLRFKARTTVAGGTLSVGYVTDVTDVMSFVTIEDLTINNTSYAVPSAEYKVIVPNTLPSNARLAIKNKNDGKAYYWDEVNWEPVPTCLEPSDLAVSNITADGATLTWTASTSSPTGGYDVYYSTTNTAPTSTSTPNVNVNSTTANLSSLTDNTTYYVWVRSHCSSTDQSTWLALPSFKTSCLPVAYMYEGFESYASGSIVPDCWVRMAAATSAGSMSISTVTPATGTKNIYQYASATQTPTIVALPVFSNVDAGTHRLRFKARISSGTGGTLSVGYVTDINDLNSFVSLEDLTINNTTYTGAAAQYQVVIPNTVPSGARLALKNKNDAKSYYWDDIYWEPNSSCEEPTTLSVTNITTTAATVNWVAPATAPANGYDVYYSLVNTAPIPTTTPTTTVSALSANLTSLNPSSVYYVWVRSRCSSTDQSPWVALSNFATACDAVNLPYVQNFDAVTVPALPNCTTNQNVGSGNNWTTIASPGYGFNSQVLRYSYSSSNAANAWFYTAGINLIAGTNYKISFDYGNNSTTYVEKMKVAFGTSADATAMTTQVVDLPNITGSAKQTVTYSFTVPTTGVYYFGFNAYSIANQYALYVDNINIDQDVLGTSEVNTKDGIMVYPNPFHDVVTISGTRDLKSVQVMDASGRLVKTIERPAAQLQLGDLKSGMYILQLVHRDGTTSSVKVMKK
nr:fibronectin type III domain-containing protein [Amniculibacterium aquaticum]